MTTAPAVSFSPDAIWPDDHGTPINAHGGGILFHDGVYYWFGEHKIAGPAGNVAHVGVHCYSSKDLYNWHDEGIALPVSHDPASDIVDGCVIERPKVLFNPRTKQFVMWFHLELKDQGYSAARVGIATSPTPTGPFRFVRSLRPDAGHWPQNVEENLKRPLDDAERANIATFKFSGNNSPGNTSLIFRRDFAGGQMSRDQTLFVDEDGAAYHICASEENATLHISRLTDDYLNTTGQYVRVFPGGFNEGPAIFRSHGKYWLITSACTGWAPNAARLAVADSIWGPWTKIGNPCVGPAEKTRITFESQSTFILPVAGKTDAFIFLADHWRPENAIDGRYVWLPIQFNDGVPFLQWRDRWNLSVFR